MDDQQIVVLTWNPKGKEPKAQVWEKRFPRTSIFAAASYRDNEVAAGRNVIASFVVNTKTNQYEGPRDL